MDERKRTSNRINGLCKPQRSAERCDRLIFTTDMSCACGNFFFCICDFGHAHVPVECLLGKSIKRVNSSLS